MPHGDLFGDHVEADAAEFGRGPREVPVHEFLRQADGLEDLGTAVRRHRGHTHLGHDLQDALAERLDQVAHGRLGGDVAEHAAPGQPLGGLHGQVRVDGGSAVADEQRHVMHLAHVTGFDDDAHHGPVLLTHQVMVDRCGQQQRRDRREVAGGVAVGQDDETFALPDDGVDLVTDLVDAATQRLSATVHPVQAGHLCGGESRTVTVGIDVADLGQVVVGDDGERQPQLAAVVAVGLQHVAFGSDRGPQRRDDLFADGVQRRVGHLSEQLGEVLEQQPGALADRRDRGVGTHRPDGLGAGAGHGRQQDADLLLGVPEGLLAAQDRLPRVDHVLPLGEVVQVDDPLAQPLVVGELCGKVGLDLVVLEDASCGGVHQEHAARLQPALAHDALWIQVQDAGLRGQHHQALVGHPEASRPQPVAVQNRADHGAVGEGHVGGTIPRLHERGMELVERTTGGIHVRVVLPRLRDHHQHRVRQGPPTHVQQFQDLVERGRVTGAGGADREQAGHVAGDQPRGEHGLARPHPVAVAHHGVDLAVVGDQPIRMRQRPGRERVRREPGVDQTDGRGVPLVAQVGVELPELSGREHAFVGDGAARQRGEVDVGFALRAFAQAEHHTFEVHAATAGSGHEQLPEHGHHTASGVTHQRRVDGQVAPAQHPEPFVQGDLFDAGHRLGSEVGVLGQECGAGGVLTCRRQVERHDRPEERVRNLGQDARAVAGVRLGARRPAVLEVLQRRQCRRHDGVARDPGQGGDEGDATGVALMPRVVETLSGGECGVDHVDLRRPWACMGRAALTQHGGCTRDDVGPRLPES